MCLSSGAIQYFAMATAPSGWLAADGSAVSRTTYASLFAAIGTTFGSGDGSTTFNLPDLRGEFVRGYDNGRGVDSGRVIGSAQDDAFKSHTHTMQQACATLGLGVGSYDRRDAGSSVSILPVTGATGSAETRPRNIALFACIKY